jgi:ribosomal protein L37AE/L43A
MGAEEKNRNEIISRIIADLSVKSKGGEELPSKIHSLRDEIKKVIENEDTIFGKIRGLVESFREIIPEERQRYNAAIKALSTTSKLSRQEVVQAVDDQLEELKILEKGLLSALPGRRDEFKAMEAKSREMRDEISKLREKLGRLESEEKEVLNGMAAREQEMALVEKAVGELFTDIGADITSIKKKVEEFTAESAASPPTPPGDFVESYFSSREKGGGEQKSEIPEPSAPQEPQDAKYQKQCPMCGGRMDFHLYDKKWRCFSCAYEEIKEEKGGVEQKSEIPEPSAPPEPQDTKYQKQCPMCGGRMDFYGNEKKWMCFSCAYESKEGEVQDKNEEKNEQKSEQTNAPKPTPASDSIFDLAIPTMSSREYREPITDPIKGSIQGSSPRKKPPLKKKPCPACGKKMYWYPEEKAWRCSSCEYERRI